MIQKVNIVFGPFYQIGRKEKESSNSIKLSDGRLIRNVKKSVKTIYSNRKRARNSSTWLDRTSKNSRVTGKVAIGRNNKIVPGRMMVEGCAENNCRFGCGKRITNEERRKIYDEFW